MRIKDYIGMFHTDVLKKAGFSPEIEISRELQRTQKTPMLFDWEGKKILGNLWTTRERIARGLKVEKEKIIPTVLSAIENPKPYEVVEDGVFTEKLPDIDDIPALRFFSEDGGRYLTSAIVSTVRDGKNNIAYHRMLIRGGHLVARLVEGRHTDRMYREAIANGEELKVAIFIGAPLEVMIAGACSVEYGQSELEIASALHMVSHGEPLKVAHIDGIPVPAESEYVLVGRITSNLEPEGPFVDITGTLDYVREQPVIEIDAVYAAPEPVYQTILPGSYEHFMMMGLPREATIYREVSKVASIRDVVLTSGGCSWLHGVVSIKKRSEEEPKKVMKAAFRGHKSMKRVIVVDEDIDVQNPDEVEWALATRFQAGRDMVVIHERGSSLDPSAYENGNMDKWGLDATKPLGKEGFERLTIPR